MKSGASEMLAFGDEVLKNTNWGDDVTNVFDPRLIYPSLAHTVPGPDLAARVAKVREFAIDNGFDIDIEAAVTENCRERYRVRSSPNICTTTSIIGGQAEIRACHCRSGLRVKLTLDVENGVASVQAKPEEVDRDTICGGPRCEKPDGTVLQPHVLARRYHGLGIGTRLYEEALKVANRACVVARVEPLTEDAADKAQDAVLAAQKARQCLSEGADLFYAHHQLEIAADAAGESAKIAEKVTAEAEMPDTVRVKGTGGTPDSYALRWKLHCEAPYTWQARCKTCCDAGISDWTTANADIFPKHDRNGPDKPNYITGDPPGW